MYYVLDENNNKIEALDKQGVLALLEQAIENGDLESIASDSAFVDKIKCCVSGQTYKMAFVTQETYNTLKANGQDEPNTFYFIINDTTCEDIDNVLEELNEKVDNLQNTLSGEVIYEGELELNQSAAFSLVEGGHYRIEYADIGRLGTLEAFAGREDTTTLSLIFSTTYLVSGSFSTSTFRLSNTLGSTTTTFANGRAIMIIRKITKLKY